MLGEWGAGWGVSAVLLGGERGGVGWGERGAAGCLAGWLRDGLHLGAEEEEGEDTHEMPLLLCLSCCLAFLRRVQRRRRGRTPTRCCGGWWSCSA